MTLQTVFPWSHIGYTWLYSKSQLLHKKLSLLLKNSVMYNHTQSLPVTIDGWHVIQRRVSHSQTEKGVDFEKKMLHLPVFKPRMYFYPVFAFFFSDI